MKTFLNLKSVYCALLVLVGFKAAAIDLYNTYPNYNGSSFTLANGDEIGNELFFGSSYAITNFSFEYYSPNATFAGDVGVDLRFYLNNGPTTNGFATPGFLFYDSGVFDNGGGLPANGFQSVNYNVSDFGPLNLPLDFTFTVTFTGLTGGDQVEIPLANPTNMFGQSFGDYWLNTPGGWDLFTNAAPASLVASVSGTPTPEPSVLYLGAVSGALLMLAGRLRKRAS